MGLFLQVQNRRLGFPVEESFLKNPAGFSHFHKEGKSKQNQSLSLYFSVCLCLSLCVGVYVCVCLSLFCVRMHMHIHLCVSMSVMHTMAHMWKSETPRYFSQVAPTMDGKLVGLRTSRKSPVFVPHGRLLKHLKNPQHLSTDSLSRKRLRIQSWLSHVQSVLLREPPTSGTVRVDLARGKVQSNWNHVS